jgi:hypothetical protein
VGSVEDLNHFVTLSCPYDSSKPCFLKTDWLANGMGWVLMQPDSSASSIQALHHLRLEGTCKFDVTMHGARLGAICFGSCGCMDREQHFHFFVGEAACGCRSISQNRKFLWGAEFFWLCSAMRESFGVRQANPPNLLMGARTPWLPLSNLPSASPHDA